MSDTKEKVIKELEKVIEDILSTHDRINDGDISFDEAGDYFHSYLALGVVDAIKNALLILRKENEK